MEEEVGILIHQLLSVRTSDLSYTQAERGLVARHSPPRASGTGTWASMHENGRSRGNVGRTQIMSVTAMVQGHMITLPTLRDYCPVSIQPASY